MNKITARIEKEFREVVPPTVFFFFVFHIVALSGKLMRLEYGLAPATVALATVGALIVAKVILIADKLPFVDRFPNRPLIYNVVWKTSLYWLFTLLFRFSEELIPLIGHHGGLVEAMRELVNEVVWPHFWGLQLWLLVFLAQYCLAREFVRAVGAQEVINMLFGRVFSRRSS